jgi:FdhD protein
MLCRASREDDLVKESPLQVGAAGVVEKEVVRFSPARPHGQCCQASVISERPLSIQVDGATYTILRTPGADRNLVVGFLFSEGFIKTPADIVLLTQCEDSPDVVTVQTSDPKKKPQRTLVITSSCGLCGREDMDELLKHLGRVETKISIPLAALYCVPPQVRQAQDLFTSTGGSHAAAFFDLKGNVSFVQEDVGRHNAFDKLVGHVLLQGWNIADFAGVFLSGRTSLELVAKAARGGIPLLAAVGAPTGAAIEAADRLGITLCGFLRGEEISVYTHAWRIAETKSSS